LPVWGTHMPRQKPLEPLGQVDKPSLRLMGSPIDNNLRLNPILLGNESQNALEVRIPIAAEPATFPLDQLELHCGSSAGLRNRPRPLAKFDHSFSGLVVPDLLSQCSYDLEGDFGVVAFSKTCFGAMQDFFDCRRL